MKRAATPGFPGGEGPRERLLAQGSDCLSDAELLALCFRTGSAGLSALALAHNLLERCGGLRNLLDTGVDQLLAHPGLGPAKVAALKAVLALAERYDLGGLSGEDAIKDAGHASRFLRQRLGAREREVFACLFLDARHRVLGFEELFFGSIDKATVHPRELVKRVLAHNAAAVILAHNHPSGVAEPSAADIELTSRLTRLLAEMDVRVVDHFVIGRGRSVSFAERQLL